MSKELDQLTRIAMSMVRLGMVIAENRDMFSPEERKQIGTGMITIMDVIGNRKDALTKPQPGEGNIVHFPKIVDRGE